MKSVFARLDSLDPDDEDIFLTEHEADEDEMAAPQPATKTDRALRFIHLRCHSAFSLLEGALRIDQIVKHAVADGAPAIGIADTSNLFGALEFSEKAAKSGVQPIIGCQLEVDFGDNDGEGGSRDKAALAGFPPLVFIATTEKGYENLVDIVSLAYLAHDDNSRPFVRFDWLPTRAEGLVVLSGGPLGPIGAALQAGRGPVARRLV